MNKLHRRFRQVLCTILVLTLSLVSMPLSVFARTYTVTVTYQTADGTAISGIYPSGTIMYREGDSNYSDSVTDTLPNNSSKYTASRNLNGKADVDDGWLYNDPVYIKLDLDKSQLITIGKIKYMISYQGNSKLLSIHQF